MIKDKSPDGKFALRMTPGKEGWDTEIIETGTKKKVIDLENQEVSGDEARVDYATRTQQPIGTYGHAATLLWLGNSQRVAYFNESRDRHATSVYSRKDSSFTEIPLPEFPRCDEVKDKDSKKAENDLLYGHPQILAGIRRALSIDKGGLANERGRDSLLRAKHHDCVRYQQHASVQKAEKKPEPVGRKIESPNGTFFVAELNAPAKDDDGRPRMDHEVWIVLAKDSATRERLAGFYEEEGSGVLNGATISPDEKWIVISQHHGSHLKIPPTSCVERKALRMKMHFRMQSGLRRSIPSIVSTMKFGSSSARSRACRQRKSMRMSWVQRQFPLSNGARTRAGCCWHCTAD